MGNKSSGWNLHAMFKETWANRISAFDWTLVQVGSNFAFTLSLQIQQLIRMSLLSLSANENRHQRVTNMSHLLILLLISFILTACSGHGQLVDTGESISFQHSQGTSFSQGLSDDAGDAFFFMDFKTRKTLDEYNSEGKCINTISIDSLSKKYGYFKSFHVSKDRIILLGEYSNQVLVLGREGKLMKHYDYRSLLDSGYELWPPMGERNGVLYVTSQSYNLNTGRDLSDCIMMSCNLNEDNPHPQALIDSFYSRFINHECFTMEFKHFECTDNYIIVTSYYNDSMYLYDYSGRLVKTVHVRSKYYQTKAPTVTEKMLDTNADTINSNLRHNGHIYHVTYDKYRDVYYCIVCGAQDKSGNYPFSIIVYDKDFKQLFEQDFRTSRHSAWGLYYYVSAKGLYLSRSDCGTEQTFSLYQLDI